MEFWKFALKWKLICPVQHKIIQKRAKETNKEEGISLTIMGQKQTYNSIHKPQRSPNEMQGFNQDDHPYRMCYETGIPEFLELQNQEIPMVMMVTSCALSLRDPTQQDFINARTLPIYINVTRVSNSGEPSSVYYAIYSVQPGRNTKNEAHAHLLGNA